MYIYIYILYTYRYIGISGYIIYGCVPCPLCFRRRLHLRLHTSHRHHRIHIHTDIYIQTVYIQRGHEHTCTGNWSESCFGSLRGAPLNTSRCLGGGVDAATPWPPGVCVCACLIYGHAPCPFYLCRLLRLLLHASHRHRHHQI